MTTADLLHQTRPDEERREVGQENAHPPLFHNNELEELRGRWQRIQGSFVDEPRTSVQQADELVASTMARLAEMFASERARLEGEWSKGEEVSTEDLRQALRRYRSFFDRLLAV